LAVSTPTDSTGALGPVTALTIGGVVPVVAAVTAALRDTSVRAYRVMAATGA
jgi:hypothetical protein